MIKGIEIYGIDISKKVFDIYNLNKGHLQFSNDEKGFTVFLKSLSTHSLVVMEATGYYHYRLAQYLHKNGVLVSVVNPLSVKRFIQMRLSKIKTDKSDAKAICEYAQMNQVPLYNALTDVQAECFQLFALLEVYLKQRTATKNKLKGEESLGKPSKVVYRSLQRNLKHLDKEIDTIELRLLELVKQEQQDQGRLKSPRPRWPGRYGTFDGTRDVLPITGWLRTELELPRTDEF